MNNINAFGGTFAFLPRHRAKQKNAKEPPSQRTKTYQVVGQHDRKEGRTANRRLAQWRVTWLIEHSTSHQLLWYIDSFVLRNPPLRQAPNR
jgi:hypothetical protein